MGRGPACFILSCFVIDYICYYVTIELVLLLLLIELVSVCAVGLSCMYVNVYTGVCLYV